MIGSGANPSGDQTRRGGGGSGVSGGPMISARSGRSPSGIGGRSGAAIVPARQLDGGTQPTQRCAGIALAGAVGASEIEIGRAHVRTPVTNAQLVCRLLLEKKKKQTRNIAT